jgi:spore coat polysaccharide biosynthesis protein SpsF
MTTRRGVWIIVSARMASARYPGKAIVPLAGRPLLEVLLERLASVESVDGVALATSEHAANRPLIEIAERLGLTAYAGDEDDVLRRYVACADFLGARHVVRVTGDNPLTDLETLALLVERHLATDAEYTYVPGDALLMGILSEVIATSALQRSWELGEARHRSELMTLYIKEHPDEFRITTLDLPSGLYRPDCRLTVDEAEDVQLMQILFERLNVSGRIVTTREALALIDRDPELKRINAHLRHKAANLRSVALDRDVLQRVAESSGLEGGSA